MKNNWLGDSSTAVAILRVSSAKQKDTTSLEAQESHCRTYCEAHGLELVESFKIVESAKDSDNRKKYGLAVDSARSRNIRHLLFYMYDREARNLTDNERNEKLVRLGAIVLHYVRDNKILHKGSSDSDFFIRDVQAAANKQFIRNLQAKVNDAMKQKAESGWYPSNCPPLGYVCQPLRDENGKELRRGRTIAIDPDERSRQQVLREFELRAMGYSYADIRTQVLKEGLVPENRRRGYLKATVEKRIKNPFYEGKFIWQGDVYQGKHDLFVPPNLIRAARETLRGPRSKYIVRSAQNGVFAGWIHCGDCGCLLTYDPKRRVAKFTGKETVYHFYRCTNGRMKHDSLRGMNVREEWLFEEFGKAVESISLTKELAARIADELNSSHKQAARSGAREIEELEKSLSAIEAREDRAYEDFCAHILDDHGYKRHVTRLRDDRNRTLAKIRALENQIRGVFRENVTSTIELATMAKSLYESRSPSERRNFLKLILSNPRVEGLSLQYDLRKPFDMLAKLKQSEEWRAQIDEFRTSVADLHVGGELENQRIRIDIDD